MTTFVNFLKNGGTVSVEINRRAAVEIERLSAEGGTLRGGLHEVLGLALLEVRYSKIRETCEAVLESVSGTQNLGESTQDVGGSDSGRRDD